MPAWQVALLSIMLAAWVMVTLGAVDPAKGEMMRELLRLLWPWRRRDRD